jgi:hypothetical protein
MDGCNLLKIEKSIFNKLIDDNNSCILKILKTYEEDRKTTD